MQIADPVIDCAHVRQCPISLTPCPGECVFAEVMQTGNLGIIVIDLAAERTLFVNPAARKILDGSAADGDFEALRSLLEIGDGSRIADGGSLPGTPVALGARLLGYTTYRSRHFVWILLRDITEKTRLEAVAEALELTNNLGYVFSAVRHELGNPINSMKVALGLLSSNAETLPREVMADYFRRMNAEVARIESLLASLKTYALHEKPNTVSVDLGQVVLEFEAMYGDEFRNKGMAFELDFPRDGTGALCDPRAVQHVLLILLSNAADALRDIPEPRIRVRIVPRENYVVLEVADNGRGMTSDELTRVFAPFFTTKSQGTGLGLVIAKKTLSKMNATLHLESTPGRGTTAVVSLPKAE
jgi:signal transduction histidine kinase